MNNKLKKQLIALAKRDQQATKHGKRADLVYRENVNQLKKIVEKYGWPKISEVGLKGVEAAWLVAQHADFDLEFQKKALKAIKRLARCNEVSYWQIAYLTDRILINQKKKQIFGTQFYKTKNSKIKLKPTENLKNLNERRKKFSLPPIEEYKKILLRKNYENNNKEG